MNDELRPALDSVSPADDPTDSLLSKIGIGLIIAFILPLYARKLFFLNLEVLGERGVPDLVKFELIYPLIAGIAACVLAKKARTIGRGWLILILGLLPFLIALSDDSVQRAVGEILNNLPGSGTSGGNMLLGLIGVLGMLAGAWALKIKADLDLAALIAAGGGGLYLISLIIPVKGQLPLLAPFKLFSTRDYSGAGLVAVSAIVSLICLALTITAAVKCLLLPKSAGDRSSQAGTAIRLWVWQFPVYGVFMIYVMIAAAGKGGVDIIELFLAMALAIGKFFPWILGLYLLIPLGVAELLLCRPSASAPPQQPS